MNSFWTGFEKTASAFGKIKDALKPGINIKHSLSPEAEAQVGRMIDNAHKKLQDVINTDLRKTLQESAGHFGEAKKFKVRDVLIPGMAAGFGVGLGHRLGKRTGQHVTNEPTGQKPQSPT